MYRVIERFCGQYRIEAMCKVFEMSRSGRYVWWHWRGNEVKDQWLVDSIVEYQRLYKRTYGIRRVRRWIQRQMGKLLDFRGGLRVMGKLSLLSVVHHRTPYTRFRSLNDEEKSCVETVAQTLQKRDGSYKLSLG